MGKQVLSVKFIASGEIGVHDLAIKPIKARGYSPEVVN
jgi:hypothetical protein